MGWKCRYFSGDRAGELRRFDCRWRGAKRGERKSLRFEGVRAEGLTFGRAFARSDKLPTTTAALSDDTPVRQCLDDGGATSSASFEQRDTNLTSRTPFSAARALVGRWIHLLRGFASGGQDVADLGIEGPLIVQLLEVRLKSVRLLLGPGLHL